MKSGTGFPHVTPPRQAGRQSFLLPRCSSPRQMHSDVLVKTTASLPPPHVASRRRQRWPSAAVTAQRTNGGSPVLKNYKLISHMTEEKTAKVKPFQVCVCVCVSYPFSSLEKSAHMTDGFKICSPNFTLFKNWV